MAEMTEIEKLKAELEAEKKKSKILEAAAEASNKKIAELEKGTANKAKPNMVQYVVKTDCYWHKVFYYEDDIAEIPEGITPPVDLFEKIGK